MAYGMKTDELALVGQHINQRGGTVDDATLNDAMDAELDVDRRESVDRFNSSAAKSRGLEARTKASIKSKAIKNLVKAGVSIAGSKGLGATAEPGVEMAELSVTTDPTDLDRLGPSLQLASSSARAAPAIGTEAYALAKDKEFEELVKRYARPGDLYGDNDPELDKLTRTLAQEHSLKNGT